jgi:elongation factor P
MLRGGIRVSLVRARSVSTKALDLRAGDLIEDESGLWRVNSNHFSRQAQGRAFAQLELRHTKAGTKKDVRMRTDDLVEKAELDAQRRLQVLYSDTSTVTVMDPVTFEQSEIPLMHLGAGAPFVADGMELVVDSFKGAIAGVAMPPKVEVEVAEVEVMELDTAQKQGRDVSAVLVNKIKIKVPKHVKVGQMVQVFTIDGTYAGKVE